MTDWDIVTGVGMTALGAAAVRAIESCRPDALVSDPYAAAFVRAAQAPWTLPVTPDEVDNDAEFPWLSLTTYAAVRAKFFDTFVAAAGEAGVRQAVTLAAGLDTRAFRLEWPPGSTVYEVDTPRVLEFPGMMRELAVPARADNADFDVPGLWPSGQQHDPADWLTRHGWVVSVSQSAAVAESYGRPLGSITLGASVLITASRDH